MGISGDATREPADGRVVEAVQAWFLQERHAKAIVDDNLSVRWVNSAASAMLRDNRSIEIRAGQLCTTDPAQQSAMRIFCCQADHSISAWSTSRPDGDGQVLILAERLQLKDSSTVGLQFIGAGSDYQPIYQGLKQAFGLTGAEHRVLLGLLNGSEAEAFARNNGTSLETARTHIRHIYAKIGVRTRESLFFKTQPFRI